jgi:hypothetical protein
MMIGFAKGCEISNKDKDSIDELNVDPNVYQTVFVPYHSSSQESEID